MTEALTPRVVVIGGGPGGYVAAIRCGQHGLDTVLVEDGRLGGTCLIRGCIPSKALIHAAGEMAAMTQASAGGRFGISLAGPPKLALSDTMRWKDGVVDRLADGVGGLLRRAGVRVVQGRARFSDARTCQVGSAGGAVTITAEHVILATGSVPAALPHIPFGGAVISSTEALALPELPRRMVIVGAGYIGLELGTAFRKFGTEVTVVEAQARILPLYDDRLTAPVRRWLEAHGVGLHLGASAVRWDGAAGALHVTDSSGAGLALPADKLLVTVGRRPATEGWGREAMALDMDGGFLRVDDRCATAMKNVWAIGDLVGEPMLAHKASAQGELVADIIAGARRRFDPVAIPAICFTDPEIVSVGAAPPAAEDAEMMVASFPFQANARALTMGAGQDGGFVRIVARRDDHRILGIQAVGAHVSELAGEFAHALEMGALLEDVAGTIHAHPTLGEALPEAALHALSHAIHI